MRPQLYRSFKNIEVKNYFSSDVSPKIVYRNLLNYALVDWPNGKPCFLVNEWLHHIAKNSTGDTVGTYAAQISHIIRYCHSSDLDFFDLNNDHMYEFAKSLVTETKYNFIKRRNNNSTRNIIQRTLAFLTWAQFNTTHSAASNFTLIGEAHTNPSITITVKINSRTSRKFYEHDCMPPDAVPESEKLPIGDPTISVLENQIGCIARSSTSKDIHYLNYLYERRLFSVWMFKRFGLRPSELTDCSTLLNSDPLKTKKIFLPTMKRRKEKPIIRTLTISTSDALRFNRYLVARKEFVTWRTASSDTHPKGLLLTLQLETLKTSSLTKEFFRLKNSAGLDDERVCISMFRHRFITREVITALKEFMSISGATRDMLTDSAVYALLKRIATKTGHASPDSLWPYVALAWASMDIWDSIDKAIEALQAADEILQDLNELPHQLKTMNCNNLDEAKLLATSIIKKFQQRGLIHCNE